MTLVLLALSPAFALDISLNPGDDIVTATSALGPGDVVTLNEGTYSVEGPVEWVGEGTESDPITIKGKGEVVVEITRGWTAAYVHDATWMNISGIHFRGAEEITDDHDAMNVSNTDHVTITDCEFGPVTDDGVAIGGNNTSFTFEHNHVHDMADGNGLYIGCYDASCWTQDSSISNNWIADVGGDYHYGLYLAPGGQANQINDNVIYAVTYAGLVVGSTEYGDPNVVEGNAIWNVAEYGLGVYGSAVVRNNVVFNIDGTGIISGDNGRNTMDNVVITHNTVYDTTEYAIRIEAWSGHTGNVLANNAATNTIGEAILVTQESVDDATYVSHNVASGLVTGLLLYTGTDEPVLPGGGETDFADPVSWNFYPSDTSALVSAADPASSAFVPEVDFNGAPRNGDSPDAGAYEWAGSGNPGWLVSEGFKDLDAYANNTSSQIGGGCCGGKKDASEAGALFFVPLLFLGARRRRS